MKRIYLYEGKGFSRVLSENYTLVDDEDYDYLMQWEWSMMKIYHTDKKIFYARRYEGLTRLGTYKAVLMHRVILKLSHKKDKGDHVDGNGLNNQRHNLRKATHIENLANSRHEPSNDNRYVGVVKTRSGKWRGEFMYNGKSYFTKPYISDDVAAVEYNLLSMQIRGDFSRLNIIRWH